MTARLVSHREHPDPFVRFPRHLLENPALSWKAKGLLAWLLDKGDFPGGWETEVARIVSLGSDGKAAVRAMLAELELAGYLERLDEGKGGRGRRIEWHVTDDAKASENRIVTEGESPIIGQGESENRYPAPTLSKTSLSKTRDGVGKRRVSLPADFDRTPERWAVASKAGVPPLDIDPQFAQFRDYHLAKGSLMADWDAAWRNWVRRYGQWGGQKAKPSQMDEIDRVFAERAKAEAAK